jgi:hypothetical protein
MHAENSPETDSRSVKPLSDRRRAFKFEPEAVFFHLCSIRRLCLIAAFQSVHSSATIAYALIFRTPYGWLNLILPAAFIRLFQKELQFLKRSAMFSRFVAMSLVIPSPAQIHAMRIRS